MKNCLKCEGCDCHDSVAVRLFEWYFYESIKATKTLIRGEQTPCNTVH